MEWQSQSWGQPLVYVPAMPKVQLLRLWGEGSR